jgi:EAL domain-containing protein (putative c-di-GMP-specific phosphodiesterase class I)
MADLPLGSTIPVGRLDHLRERAAGGRVEGWHPTGRELPPTPTIPLNGQPCLRAFQARRHDWHRPGRVRRCAAERLVERLRALVTFGSIIGTLIRPGLGARHLEAADRTALQAVIDASAFTPFFQPIVDLWDGSVVGHEALTRFKDGRPPNIVFDTAARAGLGIQLETACLRASIEASHNLPPGGYLSLNASPELVLSGQLGPVLATVARPVVLEITEHVEIDDTPIAARLAIRIVRPPRGRRCASQLPAHPGAARFREDRLDLVRGVDAEPARQALIAGMGYFAVKRKLRLVAEGIETRRSSMRPGARRPVRPGLPARPAARRHRLRPACGRPGWTCRRFAQVTADVDPEVTGAYAPGAGVRANIRS